jgi:hypothetical protein
MSGDDLSMLCFVRELKDNARWFRPFKSTFSTYTGMEKGGVFHGRLQLCIDFLCLKDIQAVKQGDVISVHVHFHNHMPPKGTNVVVDNVCRVNVELERKSSDAENEKFYVGSFFDQGQLLAWNYALVKTREEATNWLIQNNQSKSLGLALSLGAEIVDLCIETLDRYETERPQSFGPGAWRRSQSWQRKKIRLN